MPPSRARCCRRKRCRVTALTSTRRWWRAGATCHFEFFSRCRFEGVFTCWRADENFFCGESAPGLVRHAAQSQACLLDRAVFDWYCQLHGKSLMDAFLSGQSDGVQMAKIQRFMKEQNQQGFFLYCTHV
jgi:hypothetical protein